MMTLSIKDFLDIQHNDPQHIGTLSGVLLCQFSVMLNVLALNLGVLPFILLCAEYDYAEFHGAPNLSQGGGLCFSKMNVYNLKPIEARD